MSQDIPVVLLNFNRPDLTAGLIADLRQVQPRKVYFVVDGPRPGNEADVAACAAVAELIKTIDWPCDLKARISPVNLGLRRNVRTAIDWMFAENEVGIVLEDDIRFGPGLFEYFARALDAYKDDARVGAISGNNMVGHLPGCPVPGDDYFLCSIFHCWGWATWRDRWALYDDNVEQDDAFFAEQLPQVLQSEGALQFWNGVRASLQRGSVNSWAWRMQLSLWRAKRFCTTPGVNLATNVGFDGDSTHTLSRPWWLQHWSAGRLDPARALPQELRGDRRFDIFENHIILGVPMTKALDLGCGLNPKNTCGADVMYGIDVRDIPELNIKRADLVIEPIPFEDDYFEYVTAHDFIEHIPRLIYAPERRYPFIELMNEVYRVLKMGGTFMSFTPAYPHAEAFRDPTHVNIISEQTFQAYFDDTNRWAAMYGFKGAFQITSQEWRGPHLLTLLRKVPVPATGIKL